MPGTDDSGNGTVDGLFERWIWDNRRASGAVRWWPGMVMRYHLLNVSGADGASEVAQAPSGATLSDPDRKKDPKFSFTSWKWWSA